MMALVYKNKVVQVEEVSFEVADDLKWVDIPPELEVTSDWTYDGEQFVTPGPVERIVSMAERVNNLELLANDLLAVAVGTATTEEIKEKYPDSTREP